MFGAMTSLTGGGGFSNSSSATATTGEQTNNAAFQGGGVTFGAGSGTGGQTWLIIGIAIVAFLVLSKKR